MRGLRATLAFTDESGFLLAPLARRSLSRRGHTPRLVQRARHRDKVSVAAALTVSPGRGRVRLFYQTYPQQYVNSCVYARFLRRLLWRVRGPLVVVHDQGSMHKGEPLRELCRDFPSPRLDLNALPPYAPELDPVEAVWNHAKYDRLANFVPLDVPQLDAAVRGCLDEARRDQDRLRSFIAAAPLPWNGLTLLI